MELIIINQLAREDVYLFLLPLIFWSINKSLGKRLIFITTIGNFLGALLVGITGGLGLISLISFWGFLSTRGKMLINKIGCYLAIAAILFIKYSREDLVTLIISFLISAALIVTFKIVEPRLTRLYNSEYSLTQRILVVLFSCAGAFVLSIIINRADLIWALSGIGLFLGAAIGVILEKHYINFSTEFRIEVGVGRYILGLLILIPLVLLFNLVSPDSFNLEILLFIKYLLLSFTGTFIIPLLFKTLKMV